MERDEDIQEERESHPFPFISTFLFNYTDCACSFIGTQYIATALELRGSKYRLSSNIITNNNIDVILK